jgi:hypothetical protein
MKRLLLVGAAALLLTGIISDEAAAQRGRGMGGGFAHGGWGPGWRGGWGPGWRGGWGLPLAAGVAAGVALGAYPYYGYGYAPYGYGYAPYGYANPCVAWNGYGWVQVC